MTTAKDINQEVDAFREAHAPTNAIAEERKTRASSEVQAALVIAQRFHRDEIAAEQRILTACQRYSLAKQSAYAYPKGKALVTGPSIRMAETLARHWGNLKFGFTEVEGDAEYSIVEAYCWDMEANVIQSRTFRVEHTISTKQGMKKITDPRERYENFANQGARRLRACILASIPGEIVEGAMKKCQATLEKGEGAAPLVDQIKDMVGAFADIGVAKEMLEKRVGHEISLCTPSEMVNLRAIYSSIKDNQTDRSAWFDFGVPSEGGKAEQLKERLAKKRPEEELEAEMGSAQEPTSDQAK